MNGYDKIINSIREFIDFNVIRYERTAEGKDYFYLMEQSALQVLKEVPNETIIEVIYIFSERHRIVMEVDKILSAKSVKEFFNIVQSLIENGNFPCKDLTIILDNKIELSSHDEGEVHLISSDHLTIRNLIKKIFQRQYFNESFLDQIVMRPRLYHKIERPDKIIASYESFEQVIEAI